MRSNWKFESRINQVRTIRGWGRGEVWWVKPLKLSWLWFWIDNEEPVE